MPEAHTTALLSLDHISCSYDGHAVVDNLSLNIYAGDTCCLLGPSGCGKTTVLRAIAGFHQLSSGSIQLRQQTISSSSSTLPPEKRHIGMVFQDYALFPHLTVCDNITYGLHGRDRAAKERVCEEMLALVKLHDLGQRYPHELSGGQQQRVALARALAPEPSILLLDEPFSSLDVELRRSLAVEVREILKSRQITAILVTHDQEEAFAFADKIAVLHQGKIQQWATPFDLYHEPATRFVANFIGQGSFLPGHVLDSSSVATEIGVIRGNRCYDWLPDSPVEVLVRPDDIVLSENSPIHAEVTNKVFVGTSSNYTLKLPTGSQVVSAFPSHDDFEVGDQVAIEVRAEHLIAFRTGDK
ncbi:MAG: ABC transporter ATP-binding protein [Gammaproteobacteria bacterium]|nr:ABC transporter ATP-binding protein [Gammaproteobacteria bacterium]